MPIEQLNATTYSYRMPSGDIVEIGDSREADCGSRNIITRGIRRHYATNN